MSVARAAPAAEGDVEDNTAACAAPSLDAVALVDAVIDDIPLPTGGFILSSCGGGVITKSELAAGRFWSNPKVTPTALGLCTSFARTGERGCLVWQRYHGRGRPWLQFDVIYCDET